MKGEILVVEDETNIVDIVRMYLEREGFRVAHAPTGEAALERLGTMPPSLVVLDLALPGMDGIQVCRRIRSTSNLPVLMLTARADEIDRIIGLEIGADDYLTKPFSPRELVARVKAILRRLDRTPAESEPLSAGAITVWPDRREVSVDGRPERLTAKEFDLLLCLLENKGIVLSRSQILSGVWGYDYYGGERTVDAHIRTIRKKLGDSLPLTTVHGVGYKIEHER